MSLLLLAIAKLISSVSRALNLGNGGTWPGEIAFRFRPDILKLFSAQLKKGSIVVAGTNGKTTTTLMIKRILENQGYTVIHNDSGANLINGIVSAFIQSSSWTGWVDADWGVFEVDENSLPLVISNFKYQISKTQIKEKELILVFLNLFRDQLDRYGEVDVIAEKWGKALNELPEETKIILNADDPQIAFLGKELKMQVIYFGLDDPESFLKDKEHATDSTFCLNCGNRLEYEGIYYSHIGIWKCEKCLYKRPQPEISKWPDILPGLYNKYNTLAAVAVGKTLGITDTKIKYSLSDFSPAFGRQEELEVHGKKIKIFLAKNPAGFNESLRTVISLGAKEILLVLNDRIPDGKDISWIWDVDFEMMPAYITPVISGDRAHDLALRIKYAKQAHILPKGAVSEPQTPILVYEDLKEALEFALGSPNKKETLYILATYSAMLEVRKILKGRKIL